MNDLAHILIGAALVWLGVLAGAVGDRIRYGKGRGHSLARSRSAGTANASEAPAATGSLPHTEATKAMARDVVAALTTAGYTKQAANEAVWSCPASSRATLESWVRAALGRAMRQSEEQRKQRTAQP